METVIRGFDSLGTVLAYALIAGWVIAVGAGLWFCWIVATMLIEYVDSLNPKRAADREDV